MAAAVVPQIVYPLKLSNKNTVIFDAKKLEHHLIQHLHYNQTDASTLVDEITRLVRENNKSALRTAIEKRKALHLVNVLLQSVDPNERLRFIQVQAGGADGLCSIAIHHPETYRQILQSVSSDDERLQLLQRKDSNGWTGLHSAATNSATETVQVILESVSEEMCYTLLSLVEDYKWTPIHVPSMRRNAEMLEMMMRQITVEMRYKLLQLADGLGYTPLHMSASRGHTQCITIIADSVSSQQLVHLLRITDEWGATPLQLAAEHNNQAAVALLQEYQTKALIDVAVRHTDESGKNSSYYPGRTIIACYLYLLIEQNPFHITIVIILLMNAFICLARGRLHCSTKNPKTSLYL